MSDVHELARHLESPEPEVALPAVAALRHLLEALEAAQVQRARSEGWSWEAIARALGVTRQSAHKKHSHSQRRSR